MILYILSVRVSDPTFIVWGIYQLLENKTADFFIEVIRSFIFDDTNEEKYVNGVHMLQIARIYFI